MKLSKDAVESECGAFIVHSVWVIETSRHIPWKDMRRTLWKVRTRNSP